MRKKLIAGAVVAICLSLLAYSTSAYFTTEKTATNVITSGKVQIELQEWALTEDGEKRVAFDDSQERYNVMPSQEVSKIVQVENTGENAAYVRISVSKAIELAEGVQGNPDVDLVTMNFNEEDWTYKDGYYYYNESLAPGETTEKPLFTKVIFSSSMGNMYQNSTAIIKVQAQATQVKNNGTSAINAKGWPAAE